LSTILRFCEAVPVEGRLLTVPDTFDAMTSTRPYRENLPPEEAVEEVRLNRDRQFDPEISIPRTGIILNDGHDLSPIPHGDEHIPVFSLTACNGLL
jgi:hypothetical protein